MSVFFAELRKLLGSRQIVLIIAAAVIINVALLVIPEYLDYSPAVYSAIITPFDLSDMTFSVPSFENSSCVSYAANLSE